MQATIGASVEPLCTLCLLTCAKIMIRFWHGFNWRAPIAWILVRSPPHTFFVECSQLTFLSLGSLAEPPRLRSLSHPTSRTGQHWVDVRSFSHPLHLWPATNVSDLLDDRTPATSTTSPGHWPSASAPPFGWRSTPSGHRLALERSTTLTMRAASRRRWISSKTTLRNSWMRRTRRLQMSQCSRAEHRR